jgi:hypothetical protein
MGRREGGLGTTTAKVSGSGKLASARYSVRKDPVAQTPGNRAPTAQRSALTRFTSKPGRGRAHALGQWTRAARTLLRVRRRTACERGAAGGEASEYRRHPNAPEVITISDSDDDTPGLAANREVARRESTSSPDALTAITRQVGPFFLTVDDELRFATPGAEQNDQTVNAGLWAIAHRYNTRRGARVKANARRAEELPAVGVVSSHAMAGLGRDFAESFAMSNIAAAATPFTRAWRETFLEADDVLRLATDLEKRRLPPALDITVVPPSAWHWSLAQHAQVAARKWLGVLGHTWPGYEIGSTPPAQWVLHVPVHNVMANHWWLVTLRFSSTVACPGDKYAIDCVAHARDSLFDRTTIHDAMTIASGICTTVGFAVGPQAVVTLRGTTVADVQQQDNYIDCGLHLLLNARLVCRELLGLPAAAAVAARKNESMATFFRRRQLPAILRLAGQGPV